jgi:hypothetical protein
MTLVALPQPRAEKTCVSWRDLHIRVSRPTLPTPARPVSRRWSPRASKRCGGTRRRLEGPFKSPLRRYTGVKLAGQRYCECVYQTSGGPNTSDFRVSAAPARSRGGRRYRSPDTVSPFPPAEPAVQVLNACSASEIVPLDGALLAVGPLDVLNALRHLRWWHVSQLSQLVA